MRFRPPASRDVRWTPVDGEGSEHLHLAATPDGVVASSSLRGDRGGQPYDAVYEIDIDAGWRVRRFSVRTAQGRSLSLVQARPGLWTGGDGNHRADLDGCIDIDLAATPFTNTLPVRRLEGRLATPTELRMVFVPFDTLAPFVDGQRYTEMSPRLYRYEAVDGTFSAELPVDEDGLVTDYPTLFRRV